MTELAGLSGAALKTKLSLNHLQVGIKPNHYDDLYMTDIHNQIKIVIMKKTGTVLDIYSRKPYRNRPCMFINMALNNVEVIK